MTGVTGVTGVTISGVTGVMRRRDVDASVGVIVDVMVADVMPGW